MSRGHNFGQQVVAILAIPTLSVAGLTTRTPRLRKTTLFSMINLFRMSDLLLLTTDAQKELRRKGETLNIPEASLAIRLQWAVSLYTSLRGVGWTYEPKSHLPPASKDTQTTRFILRQAQTFTASYFLLNFGSFLCLPNPSFSSNGPPFSSNPWWLRPTVLGHTILFYGSFQMLYALSSTLGVTLHLSAPKDWPPFMGRVSGSYTVRRYWGRVWHQVLRKFLKTHSALFANALRIPKGCFRTYFCLFIAFFISGIIHQFGDYIVIQAWSGGSLTYFLLQACAITFEDAVQAIVKMSRITVQPVLARLLGYIWVLTWFSLTIPIWCAPLVRAGLTPDKVSRNAVVENLARTVAIGIMP